MFEKIRKMKNKKGFTLVELIVVLVILAILAAMLVPALTGYIDKANKEKVIATTRMVVMAAQTEASEKYGLKAAGQLNGGNDITVSYDGTTATAAVDGIDIKAIGKLAEVMDDADAFVNGVTSISVTINAKGTVTDATVVQSGFTCTYDADGTDKYSVAD
ncbi:MAG: type II secretion system protein [Gemmiger formicilis]|uniref:type II secretion system protein n=1 Tax=Gemmiger formicilis TaxID=745368 RepID=UPI003992068F